MLHRIGGQIFLQMTSAFLIVLCEKTKFNLKGKKRIEKIDKKKNIGRLATQTNKHFESKVVIFRHTELLAIKILVLKGITLPR